MNLICIGCPVGCALAVGKRDNKWIVDGNQCAKGRDFGISEATNPKRSLSTTVKTTSPEMPRLPVKTDGEIPLGLLFKSMELINRIELARPIATGDVIVKNILNTGVNIVSTCSL